jgi:hypothetical protein
VLSTVGLSAALYAVIEAPTEGWTATPTLGVFAVSAVSLLAFVGWELRTPHPVLDVRLFANRRFSAGAGALAAAFFVLFSTMFALTQYLQFVLGLSPLATGVRLLALAVPSMILSPVSASLARAIGTKATVAIGMACTLGSGLLLTQLERGTSFFPGIFLPLVFLSAGVALTGPPATEAIIGSLPMAKAGVGSAVNNATRLVGGAIGIAVVGSVLTSRYADDLEDRSGRIPPAALEAAKDGIGNAFEVAHRLGGDAGALLVDAAKDGFIEGLHRGALVGALVAAMGAIGVLRWLPAHARQEDVAAHEAEYAAAQTARRRAGEHDGHG